METFFFSPFIPFYILICGKNIKNEKINLKNKKKPLRNSLYLFITFPIYLQIIDARNTDQEILIFKRSENCLIERQNSKNSLFLFPLAKKKKILYTISVSLRLKLINQNRTTIENIFPTFTFSFSFLPSPMIKKYLKKNFLNSFYHILCFTQKEKKWNHKQKLCLWGYIVT